MAAKTSRPFSIIMMTRPAAVVAAAAVVMVAALSLLFMREEEPPPPPPPSALDLALTWAYESSSVALGVAAAVLVVGLIASLYGTGSKEEGHGPDTAPPGNDHLPPSFLSSSFVFHSFISFFLTGYITHSLPCSLSLAILRRCAQCWVS